MHNFKKEFGQNFLKNSKYAKKLVEYSNPELSDTVIEIGPGDGLVTSLLLEVYKKVFSIEVDYDLLPKLLKRFHGKENFELVHEDILKINFLEFTKKYNITPEKPVNIAGSLPYNISKKIIADFLKLKAQGILNIKTMTFIVQEEVAKEYVAAVPKSSFLSNYLKIYGRSRKFETIPADQFFPTPKVNGAILYIQPDEIIRPEYIQIAKFIKEGFKNPRKTVSNNLKSIKEFNGKIGEVLSQLNIKSTARPAELTFEEWIKLYEALKII